MTQERNENRACMPVPGQIVRSLAGHDRGSVFLVLDIPDAKHVRVVDGKHRTLAHPKKKRVIHVQKYRYIVPGFETMKKDRDFHDARIRQILLPFLATEEDSKCHQKM
ncbi:MAG: KOW domain-containing RNA-binding protein [Peptoniphilaceae bacterium]|nr:KOW domain-containing RNA-binding protein [Peptoniphilaceae bacterium]MDY5766047.1 KOW domain-containing RNA-binding protein [Peptoniphilaceae bacterium]